MPILSSREFAERLMELARPAHHFDPTATQDPDDVFQGQPGRSELPPPIDPAPPRW